MEPIEKKDMYKIERLFDGWNETPIWSCLQGYMGDAWADDALNPTSAQIIVGDLCFFAGMPNLDLAKNIPTDFSSEFLLMIPQTEDWEVIIEQAHVPNCEKIYRYAIKKELDVFNRVKLQTYIEKLPTEYELRMIDETLYKKAKTENWSKDLCSQFPSYQKYNDYGIGVMALYGNEPVSGASSYTVYDKGIEIEIDTKPDFRHKGLALACASKLILECLDKGVYPSWDAHDMRSVALAEKLGYHLDKGYVTYIISNPN